MVRAAPPLHIISLKDRDLSAHLYSACPYNQTVTTITCTAKIFGPLSRLDTDLQLLDIYTTTFRTGSTRFKNARVVRLRLKSERGLRWITFKCFQNGTLHICGVYSLDVGDFAVRELLKVLNALHPDPIYDFAPGNVLLANYRLTLGKRIRLHEVQQQALSAGHLPWLDARELAVVVKIEVEIGCWATARIFPTGSVAISVPNCNSHRAQVGALDRVCAFLRLL